MNTYQYQAFDANGVLRSGELVASARQSALDLLHKRGLVPFIISDRATGNSSRSLLVLAREALSAWKAPRRLSLRQLVSLTRALASLLGAGLTVDRALTIAASLENSPPAVQFYEDLARAVRAGASFTTALGGSGLTLPEYYLSMVEAGELGGSLSQTLARACALLQQNLDIRARIQAALLYPTILCCVVLGTLAILIVVVLPQFQTLFAESEVPLPWSTRTVLGLGEMVEQYWPLSICLLTAGLIAARFYRASNAGRQHIDRWLLHSRLTFGLPASIETARMLRTLATLLQNGVSVSAALRVSQGTLTNTCLRSALERVTQKVNAGEGLATSLAASRVFPGEAVQLAQVGEESGRLHELLIEAASILETGAARQLERLLALLVPAVTVFMGMVIAALIGSVLIGLLSINDLAS